MIADLSFGGVQRIEVHPAKSRVHANAAIGIYTTQRLTVAMNYGKSFELVFEFEDGSNTLAVGDLVTNTLVPAPSQGEGA